MKYNIPYNKSIVILSSPRTGSTALSLVLEKEFKYKFFNEPSFDKKVLNDFLRYSELGNKFILKEHAFKFIKNYSSDFTTDNFVIRIGRKNVFEQILSNYIALIRKKFIYERQVNPDIIPLNKEHLLRNVEYIEKYNRELENFKGKVDLDLIYEDFIRSPLDIETIPTPKPNNNEELCFWAKEVLKGKYE